MIDKKPETKHTEKKKEAKPSQDILNKILSEKKPQKDDSQEKISDLNQRLLRMAAELENTKKRAEIQNLELKKYAIQGFAKEVVAILENFHLIMDNAPSDEIKNNQAFVKFFQGIEITHQDLTKVLEKSGIKRIYPLGQKFDHHIHQAISKIDSKEESGTVIQVVQAGYILNDRLLKEAMVVVAK